LHLYCELLIYKQECKFCCVDNDLDGNYSSTTADGVDPATQTSDGKLMSAGTQIYIRYSFRETEGSTSYTSDDKPRKTEVLLLWQYLFWRGIGPTVN